MDAAAPAQVETLPKARMHDHSQFRKKTQIVNAVSTVQSFYSTIRSANLMTKLQDYTPYGCCSSAW